MAEKVEEEIFKLKIKSQERKTFLVNDSKNVQKMSFFGSQNSIFELKFLEFLKNAAETLLIQ